MFIRIVSQKKALTKKKYSKTGKSFLSKVRNIGKEKGKDQKKQ